MSLPVRLRWALAVACVVSAVGCTDRSTPPEASRDEAARAPQPPPDRSLTLDQYIEAGVPAHDRGWAGDDVARAVDVLGAMVRKDAGQLPRYRSPRSGLLFERLLADENLDLYRNLSVPLEQRFPDALKYQQSNNLLLKLYLAAYNGGAVGTDELVELFGGQLRISAAMLRLVDEFLPTLDENDPTYAVRMDGLQRMKNGMAMIVAGSLQTLTEEAYQTTQLSRFVGYMCETFPEILPALPPGTRSETLVRVRAFASDPEMQPLRADLVELVAVVERSTDASAVR